MFQVDNNTMAVENILFLGYQLFIKNKKNV